jgi:transketolase
VALAARDILATDGIRAAVVSIPCWELFDAQDPDYRASVLGPGCPRVAVEAAVSFGWERYLGESGAFVGMSGFGASAPGPDLYEHFAITAEAVSDAAKALLKRA